MTLNTFPGSMRQFDRLVFATVFTLAAFSLLIASADAFGAESATLDQCANGPLSSPDPTPCQGDEPGTLGWANGNLGESKAHYIEGGSISYRMRFGDLAPGVSHEVIIEWDTTQGGKHAIDYLTTWNRSVDSHPFEGMFAGPVPAATTYPIEMDPQADAWGVGFPADDPAPVFTLWGGTIVSTSAITYPDGLGFVGDKSARMTITFVADVSNPVLAWGGHIATRADWGDDTAASISGSPFHTRLIDLNGSGGNQDRSLSTAAVVYPARVTLIKETIPEGTDQDFDFTIVEAGGDTTALTLNAATHPEDGIADILIVGSLGVDFAVTEEQLAPWNLDDVSCTVDYPAGGTSTRTGDGIDLNIQEGEYVTCTFVNSYEGVSLTLIKEVDNTGGGTAAATDFALSASGPDGLFSGNGFASASDLPAGTYVLAEDSTVANYLAGDWICDGVALAGNELTLEPQAAVTCVITNTFLPDPSLAFGKQVVAVDAAGNGVLDTAGDLIDYALVVTNTGNVTLTNVVVTDPLTGTNANVGDLAPGQTDTVNASYAVTQADLDSNGGGDGDIDNTATADSDQTAPTDDSEEVPVEQNPSMSITKTGALQDTAPADGYPDPGEQIAYTILVANTGNVSLTSVSVTDAAADAGSIILQSGDAGGDGVLSVGEVWTYSAAHTLTAGEIAAGSFVNTASADSTETDPVDDSHEEPLKEHPTLRLHKAVNATFGGAATGSEWTLSAAGPTPFSGQGPDVYGAHLAAGAYSLSESGTLPGYENGTTFSCVVDGGPAVDGNSVTLADGQDATCTITNTALPGAVTVFKTTNGSDQSLNVWTFALYDADGYGLAPDATPPSLLDFGGTDLVAGETYTLCETGLFGGWTSTWWSADGTFIPFLPGASDAEVTEAGYSAVFDPNYTPDPNDTTDNSTVCLNFVVGLDETLSFDVDNSYPGGQARAGGYWKNWNTCSGGNQVETAGINGGFAEGYALLDDLLAPTPDGGPGLVIGTLELYPGDCHLAVLILDKRQNNSRETKRAKDGAYKLAAQLLAAQVNFSVGAYDSPEAVDAAIQAQALLESYGFDGTASHYLSSRGPTADDYELAVELAAILDAYNSNLLQ